MLSLVRAHCCPLCSLWTLGLLLLLTGLALYSVLHPYISSRIRSGLLAYSVLSSPSAGQWKGFVDSRDPTGPTVLSTFYFYDYLNPEEVLAGGKPIVQAVGPMVYTYINTKHNVSWDSFGDELVYTEYQRFYAADDATRAFENQMVTTPDILLLAALRTPGTRDLMPLLKNNSGGLFQRRRLYDVLWGYSDPILLGAAFPGIQPNDTSLAQALLQHSPTRIATGAHNPGSTMEYLEWDGGNNLQCCAGGVRGEAGVSTSDGSCSPAWGTGEASRVRGIFGTATHPFLSPTETVHLATYPFGIYRHWPLQCAPVAQPAGPPWAIDDRSDLTASIGSCDSYSVNGVSLLKFALPPWVMGNASVSASEAAGYGITGPSGLVGVAQCERNAPIFMSRPLFLYGSDSLRAAMNGTGFEAPSPQLHDSYLGIEPLTGSVLDFHFRLAFNVHVQPETVHTLGLPFTYFESVAPAYLPIGWGMQESSITDAQTELFMGSVYTPLKVNAAAKWAGVGAMAAGGLLVALELARAAHRQYRAYKEGSSAAGSSSSSGEPADYMYTGLN